MVSHVLLLTSLILESAADFFMNKDNLKLPIILFSFGHLFRQFAFLSVSPFGITPILVSFITAILTILVIKKFSILYYSCIIFLSAVQVSLVESGISYGYILFIVSDLIIGYEMVISKIKPRCFRIIIVPLFYWISQYCLVNESLQLK